MKYRQALGKKGERLVCEYAAANGMRVVDRNWHCRSGEIDIVAREGDTVVFIEVKTRTSERYGWAAEAVTPAKIRKIMAAAVEYMAENAEKGANVRFDVAEVYIKGESYQINYIKSAFEG